MSFSEAIKGARIELAGLPSLGQKAARVAKLARILGSEALGTVAMAPYGLAASRLHSRLPSLDEFSSGSSERVYLMRDVPYGARPRNVMDIYLPREAAAAHQAGSSSCRLPVVLFCHGGVWASGAKWHYSPMGSALAQLGVVSVMMQYTLYPQALMPQLVEEVAQCMDWVQANIGKMGGDRDQLSLVGHSAGAHLCALMLIDRAKALQQQQQQQQQQAVDGQQQRDQQQAQAGGTSAQVQRVYAMSALDGAEGQEEEGSRSAAPAGSSEAEQCSPQMPARFIGMAGVYDIAQHYEYESSRGVHEISTMKRVMGGAQGFGRFSPTVLLREAAATAGVGHGAQALHSSTAAGAAQRLHGHRVISRIGLDRHLHRKAGSTAVAAGSHGSAAAGHGQGAALLAAAAQLLPPSVLMSSCDDITVPWLESAEMYWRLHDLGVPVQHLMYQRFGHGEYVTGFKAAGSMAAGEDADREVMQQLPHALQDLVQMVADGLRSCT